MFHHCTFPTTNNSTYPTLSSLPLCRHFSSLSSFFLPLILAPFFLWDLMHHQLSLSYWSLFYPNYPLPLRHFCGKLPTTHQSPSCPKFLRLFWGCTQECAGVLYALCSGIPLGFALETRRYWKLNHRLLHVKLVFQLIELYFLVPYPKCKQSKCEQRCSDFSSTSVSRLSKR